MPHKTIVITGSTRGIGYGLAQAFLNLGCNVVVSGRDAANVCKAVSQLSSKHASDKIHGCACDVSVFGQVEKLWHGAKERFGAVDVWINNAGLGQPTQMLWELDASLIEVLVKTNVLGAMNGAKVAIKGMVEQGHGALYNMEGFGSDGRTMKGLTLYGASKYGLAYLTNSLAKEVRGTNVVIGALMPGMVVTDLITKPYEGKPEEWKKVKAIFSILADRVENVAPWLAEKVLANSRNGARFNYFGTGKMIYRFITAPIIKRDPFKTTGENI